MIYTSEIDADYPYADIYDEADIVEYNSEVEDLEQWINDPHDDEDDEIIDGMRYAYDDEYYGDEDWAPDEV